MAFAHHFLKLTGVGPILPYSSSKSHFKNTIRLKKQYKPSDLSLRNIKKMENKQFDVWNVFLWIQNDTKTTFKPNKSTYF